MNTAQHIRVHTAMGVVTFEGGDMGGAYAGVGSVNKIKIKWRATKHCEVICNYYRCDSKQVYFNRNLGGLMCIHLMKTYDQV